VGHWPAVIPGGGVPCGEVPNPSASSNPTPELIPEGLIGVEVPTSSVKLREAMGAPLGGADCAGDAGVVGAELLTALGAPGAISVVISGSSLFASLTGPAAGIGDGRDGRGIVPGVTGLAATVKRELVVAAVTPAAPLRVVTAELTTRFTTGFVCGTDAVTCLTGLAATGKRELVVAVVRPVT
jgi:hypothetical protein